MWSEDISVKWGHVCEVKTCMRGEDISVKWGHLCIVRTSLYSEDMYVKWGHVCKAKTCMRGEDSITEVDQLCTLVSHWRGRGSFFYRLLESLRSWSSAVAGVRAASGFLAGSQTVFSGCWAPPGLSPVSCWDESEPPCSLLDDDRLFPSCSGARWCIRWGIFSSLVDGQISFHQSIFILSNMVMCFELWASEILWR